MWESSNGSQQTGAFCTTVATRMTPWLELGLVWAADKAHVGDGSGREGKGRGKARPFLPAPGTAARPKVLVWNQTGMIVWIWMRSPHLYLGQLRNDMTSAGSNRHPPSYLSLLSNLALRSRQEEVSKGSSISIPVSFPGCNIQVASPTLGRLRSHSSLLGTFHY